MPATTVKLLARILRDAEWLNSERAQIYSRILLAVTLIVLSGWFLLSPGGIDPAGKPVGTDFLSFWTASKFALEGHPALAYDIAVHDAASKAVLAGARCSYPPYFYPPPYLLVCLPFALAPYLPALATWLAVTAYACWRTIRSILGRAGTGLLAPMLAFPGVFQTISHGQNAFLTTALFGSGVLALGARPIIAGVCFGLLAFKPQLALMIPLALLAAGRWRILLAAGATVTAFCAASLVTFGGETWRAFFAMSPIARMALDESWSAVVDHDGWMPTMMPSAFAAVRVLHGGLGLAYAVQGALAIVAGVVVVRVARRRPVGGDGVALGVVMVCATVLASPYLLDYDLMILAIPIAWMVREAHGTGFLPWEKTVLFAAFLLPLVSHAIAARLGAPIGPPVLLALLFVVTKRALGSRVGEARPAYILAPAP